MARSLLNLFFVLLVAAMATVTQARLTFSHNFCGDPTDAIQPATLNVSPANVNPGTNVTFTTAVNVTRTISNGTVAIVAQSNGANLWQNTTDICSFVSTYFGMNCPIQPGVYNLNEKTMIIPDPLGNVFVVNFYAFDLPVATVNSILASAQQFIFSEGISALYNVTLAMQDPTTLNAKLMSYEGRLLSDLEWSQQLEKDLKPMWCSQLVTAIRPLF